MPNTRLRVTANSSKLRKRKSSEKSGNEGYDSTVDMNNVNSNCIPETEDESTISSQTISDVISSKSKSNKAKRARKNFQKSDKNDSMEFEAHETAEFQEGDEIVNMETKGHISSDGELDTEPSDSEENLSEDSDKAKSLPDSQQNTNYEENEIDHDESDYRSSNESHSRSVSSSSSSESEYKDRRKRRKNKKKKRKRSSVMATLDNLTETLGAMQKLMKKKGLFNNSDDDKLSKNKEENRKKTKEDRERNKPKNQSGNNSSDNTADSSGNQDMLSDSTIYKNVLEKVDNSNNVIVDQEISFKVNSKRDSSSSEDKFIDTSDELFDRMDENEHFIADCEAEARRMSYERKGDRVEPRHKLKSRVEKAQHS